jgi:hypothetical protein
MSCVSITALSYAATAQLIQLGKNISQNALAVLETAAVIAGEWNHILLLSFVASMRKQTGPHKRVGGQNGLYQSVR